MTEDLFGFTAHRDIPGAAAPMRSVPLNHKCPTPVIFLWAGAAVLVSFLLFCALGCAKPNVGPSATFRAADYQVGHAATNFFDSIVAAELRASRTASTNSAAAQLVFDTAAMAKTEAFSRLILYQAAASNYVWSAATLGTPKPEVVGEYLEAATNALKALTPIK